MIRIALADSFHIHDRNFPSLFAAIGQEGVASSTLLSKDDDGYKLITSTGDYRDLEERASPLAARFVRNEAEVFKTRDADTLYGLAVHNLALWPLCRSEFLAFALTQDNWQQEVIPKDDRAIFDKAYSEDLETLALNMAMASYWLNHWYDIRKEVFGHHYCCVFSGSMTYARTLMALLRRSPTKCYVLESTFTGNDFIFEEMYHPVANNLGVQHANVRQARRQPELEELDQYDREVIKARNKILSAANKNVVQPPDSALPAFPEERPIALVVGQVVNDFSLIESGFPYVGSIAVYRELLQKLLDETEYNIIFKSHPWENKKVHLQTPKTFDALADMVAELPEAQRARVLLVEDVNLHGLIDRSQYFLTFCSQAGIEAALLGLRPFVLGKAFYSGAGFTVDCPDIDSMVQAVQTQPGELTLADYKCFDRFLVDLFQYGTVSIFESGEKKVARLLARSFPLEQKTPIKSELALGGTQYCIQRTAAQWSGIVRKKVPLPHRFPSAEDYAGVSLKIVEASNTYQAGQSPAQLLVELVNNAPYLLPAKFGVHQFALSYHVYDAEGERYEWNGHQTLLTDLIQNEYKTGMTFYVPEQPGTYSVVPALLLPGKFWLDDNDAWEITVA